jgi:hypothetical protein
MKGKFMDYESRVIKVIVAPKGEPIFSSLATFIEIDDEAAGEYVKITQPTRHEDGNVCFDRDEWELVKLEVDKAFANCRKNKEG